MARRYRAGGDVSIFEVITSYTDVSPKFFLVGTATVIALADMACAIVLYGEVHEWSASAWWPLTIFKNTWDAEVSNTYSCIWWSGATCRHVSLCTTSRNRQFPHLTLYLKPGHLAVRPWSLDQEPFVTIIVVIKESCRRFIHQKLWPRECMHWIDLQIDGLVGIGECLALDWVSIVAGAGIVYHQTISFVS